MKRAVLSFVLLVLVAFASVACFLESNSSIKKPPSGSTTRVMVSQDVSAGAIFGGIYIIDVNSERIAHAREINAGTEPGYMVLSPGRGTLLAFDAGSNSVNVINTATESNVGALRLPGPTNSIAFPLTTSAFAAVPAAPINGYPNGAIEAFNPGGGPLVQIGVPDAQFVLSNANGTQLLVMSPFSLPSISNSIYVINPLLAVGPIDQGCDNLAASQACTIVPGFDQPVYGIVNGNTAYILNCGAECGGTQASVAVFDMTSLTITQTIPVNGATWAFLSGNVLFVAGKGTPTGPPCASIPSAGTTQAQYCGTLDIINLTTMTDPYFNNPAQEIAIPDGYHNQMDLEPAGQQLFIGSVQCTNIGNSNSANPSGEIRGCLAIFDTTKLGNTTAIIPPETGDVTGLQGFSSYFQEYVAQNGTLWVYDTQTDTLLINSTLTLGTIGIAGQVDEVKAVDFF